LKEKIRVKICCIQSIKEAQIAIKFGASAIGLVSEMPSGPGVISEDLISEIAAQVPSEIKTFLLTSKTEAGDIISQHSKCKTTTLQLVDSVKINVYQKLREALIGISIVQVIHVQGEESIKVAMNVDKYVDAILLDSGNQSLKVKELGGTGRIHNWEISREIGEQVNVPVYLAGGINAENVKDAVEFVKPYGIDLCNGVRTNGKLDENKLKKFFGVIQRINLH
jgi:phosphoribosylanthranilate isomerase